MIKLLEIREYLRRFYSKYELYIVPAFKFIMALLVFLLINSNLGYMEKIAKVPLMFVLALACSFLPISFTVIIAVALILLHVYALSMEVAAVVGVVFVLVFLLYIRMSPKEAIITLITPICFALHIPYVLPITIGLVGSPSSVFSVGCGIVVFYTLKAVTQMSDAIDSLDSEGAVSKVKFIIDAIIQNKTMMVMVAAFAATILVVYFVHRLNIDHAWTVATIVGALTNALIILVGDLMFVTNASLIGVLGGTVLAVAVVYVLKFFMFNLDYARTERVQFEDDEYYYYVKAVPKITLQEANKTVKKVSATKTTGSKSADKDEASNKTTGGRVAAKTAGAKATTAKTASKSVGQSKVEQAERELKTKLAEERRLSEQRASDNRNRQQTVSAETKVIADRRPIDEGRVVEKRSTSQAESAQRQSDVRSASGSRIAGDLATRRQSQQTRVRNDGYAGPSPEVGMTNGESIAERIRKERLREAESIDADRLRRQNKE